MSVQFGRWNFDGKPVDGDYLEKVSPLLAPYGPDDSGSYSKGNISILYRAFHTTKESRGETQPHVTESGTVITWDGRLDNRKELIRSLRDALTMNSKDVSIVAAAYEEWGSACSARLIGDWALSIWDANSCTLILAKDPIGTRHLYYSVDEHQVTWSTILDPLVLCAGKTFALCEEYIAGWFSFFPATHLTPYVGIHSVPASSLVLIRAGKYTVRKYWDFDPGKRIRHRTDAEYEEHFRAVFWEAVRRRLRSDRPILAELSGGMDSSSIVCMADTLIALGTTETPRLDTISYYDDSEPSWHERPYFTKVEEKRGRRGWHVDLNAQERQELYTESRPESLDGQCGLLPGSNGRTSSQLRAYLTSQCNRVLLSGVGGDEVMGGVPTPLPELEDLVATAQFAALARQLKVWALEKRKPWFHLFWEVLGQFFPPALVGIPKYTRPAPWLQSKFVKRQWAALTGYSSRTKLFGPLPSFRANMGALEGLRRQLTHCALPFDPPLDKRYPYLDRDLLEFIFAIPREQLVRPKQRRSLMRRALVGIVPDEILNRKSKAFVTRAPLLTVSRDWARLAGMTQDLTSSLLGIIDADRVSDALQKARRGEEVPLVSLLRTVVVERWLRNLDTSGIIRMDITKKLELTWQASADT